MKKIFLAHSMALALCAAQAQTAGSWLVQGGFGRVSPNVSGGNLSAPSAPGSQIELGSDLKPTAQVGYMLTDHWALAVPLGTGFKHKIYGAGAIAGTGTLGSVTSMQIGRAHV